MFPMPTLTRAQIFLAQSSSSKTGQWVNALVWLCLCDLQHSTPLDLWYLIQKMQRILAASLLLFQAAVKGCGGGGWEDGSHESCESKIVLALTELKNLVRGKVLTRSFHNSTLLYWEGAPSKLKRDSDFNGEENHGGLLGSSGI